MGDDAVSRSVLRSVYIKVWKSFLGHRTDSQGKRCQICARLDVMRDKATTLEEKGEYRRDKKQHTNDIQEMRTVLARLCHLSKEAAKHPSEDGFQQPLLVVSVYSFFML